MATNNFKVVYRQNGKSDITYSHSTMVSTVKQFIQLVEDSCKMLTASNGTVEIEIYDNLAGGSLHTQRKITIISE